MRLRREDPRFVGPYRLHRRLGAGGMGVVYLGSDRKGQKVALKLIRAELAEDAEFRTRFAREVAAAARIRGGCIARLVSSDIDAERPWLATVYVPGPSLYKRVGDDGPMPWPEVAAVGSALADGLRQVHDAGVVHRDLKPSNILLSPKGPRIIDFGIAWSSGASTLTHVGTAVGSPGFLAPEQVRGVAVTGATDVFALGSTLAYAATGDTPFGSGSSEVMLYRVVHEEPDLTGVPAALVPLIRACLAKDATERPTPAQVYDRLGELAARGEAIGRSIAPQGHWQGHRLGRGGHPVSADGDHGTPHGGPHGAPDLSAHADPNHHGQDAHNGQGGYTYDAYGQAPYGDGLDGGVGHDSAGHAPDDRRAAPRRAASAAEGHPQARARGGAGTAGRPGVPSRRPSDGPGDSGARPQPDPQGAPARQTMGPRSGAGAAGRSGAPPRGGAAGSRPQPGRRDAGVPGWSDAATPDADAQGRSQGPRGGAGAAGNGSGARPAAGRRPLPPTRRETVEGLAGTPTRRPGEQARRPGSAPDARTPSPRPARQASGAPRTPTPGRPGAGRPGGPTTPSAARRKLLRQRLIVFITVTVGVALAIATAQGCENRNATGESPARPAPQGVNATAAAPVPAQDASPGLVPVGTGDAAARTVAAVDWGSRSYQDPADGSRIDLAKGHGTGPGAPVTLTAVLPARYAGDTAAVVVLTRRDRAVPEDMIELYRVHAGAEPVLLAAHATTGDPNGTSVWQIQNGAVLREEHSPQSGDRTISTTRYTVAAKGTMTETWPGTGATAAPGTPSASASAQALGAAAPTASAVVSTG